jgi:hypothetical protein
VVFEGWKQEGVCPSVATNYTMVLLTNSRLPAVYKGLDISETHEDDIEIKEAQRGTETRSRA